MKVPYHLIAAVGIEQRYAQMASAIARGLPRLERRLIDDSRTLCIAAYGPSLKDTWRELRHPMISMSGATKFLVERGVIPDYHLDMDPRKHKAMTSLPAVEGVTYLIASVCAPEYFDALQEANAKIVLWHCVSSNWEADRDWVARHDGGEKELVISTGSTIGLGAIQVGGVLGYRRFELHGMDGSFVGEDRHAGPHAGKKQPPTFTWDAGKVTYRTSQIMANAVAETINTFRDYPIFGVFYGHGLTQALIREENLPNACCADQFEKRARMMQTQVNIADAPAIPKGRGTVWDGFLTVLKPEDLPELVGHIAECEPRRAKAKYNTGSIPFETAVLLRAACRHYRPTTIAEIGTFIGTSTHALLPERVIYTCDVSNDCLPGSDRILTHPMRTSTQMFQEIQEPIDLFFFDGRIADDDIAHIKRLSHARTVYLFDDCHGREKGIVNIAKLAPHCPGYLVAPPPPTLAGRTTLGALIPRVA